MYLYTYIYIYLSISRSRSRFRSIFISMSVYIYIYICIHTGRLLQQLRARPPLPAPADVRPLQGSDKAPTPVAGTCYHCCCYSYSCRYCLLLSVWWLLLTSLSLLFVIIIFGCSIVSIVVTVIIVVISVYCYEAYHHVFLGATGFSVPLL